MRKIKEYKIVSTISQESLQEKVNTFLSKGYKFYDDPVKVIYPWECLGGATIVRDQYGFTTWIQTLIREIEEDCYYD